MKDQNRQLFHQKILYFKTMLAMVMYAFLAVFCLTLVIITTRLWPYLAKEHSDIQIILTLVTGILSAIMGLRFSIILWQVIKLRHMTLSGTDYLYIPHLLPLSILLYLAMSLYQ